ncbi:MAG: NUDIX domain-containing protein [Thaumarchaeota archaeon]|nr:NUDIX domain-containing protein [Nitrososphaerota archaeon]
MEERSAGAVVFIEKPEGRKYLLLMNAGRLDFPKGNMEKGENELETVMREVGEETALKDIDIVPGFKRIIEYYYRREGKNVHKKVTYFLARTLTDDVKISFEHQGFGWFPYQQAMVRASYDNSRSILVQAESFLGGNPRRQSELD